MNQSGQAISKVLDFYKVGFDNLTVVHDDLDIRLGEFKIQKGKGPKVHNGVSSVEEAIGTSDFVRVRIGVDNRPLENRMPGKNYVLQDFSPEELEVITGQVFPQVVEELKRMEKLR